VKTHMNGRARLPLRVSVAAAIIGIVAAAAGAGPASAGTSRATATPVPAGAGVVTVLSAPQKPVAETVQQFMAKAARDGVSVPTSTAASLTAAAASTSCWYWNDWRKAYGLFGNTLWTFNVEPNWCGNGSWIVNYAYTNTWGDTSTPGWSYKGVISSSNHYGVGWNVFESVRQGSFCLISYFGCVQNSYPYVDVEVGAGGQIYKS
jgi:hypothetical protein